MRDTKLLLPIRLTKTRHHGITILIDSGLPTDYFRDVITSHHSMIDFVKFGWGTSIVSQNLQEKIRHLQDYNVDYFFGGTLFEKYVLQDKVQDYIEFCLSSGCKYTEISNGTIDLSNEEKCSYIERFSKHFEVFSEVGYKDSDRSLNLHPAKWIEYIRMDFEAGATKVITEARESGTSGICRSNGEVRFGLIEEIIESDLDSRRVIFEAPNKELQTYFIQRLGSNVNLANISFEDIVSLETLRLGLRSDTLLDFDGREQPHEANFARTPRWQKLMG